MMKTVPTEIDDKKKMSELMRGHLDNIGKLAKDGKLSVAGPFFDKNDRDYRDVFNFNVKSIDEANAMMETDPAVMAGVFAYESFKWYGSAALPMYLRYHGKIFKENPYIMESNYLDSVKKTVRILQKSWR
ncbi:hypothetical protein [Soonwooa sp.]|uniref:YciI family protein n=1 Tax=Soonwooa sp. TaxID=1938592 RepID=UPI0028A77E7C|nr:hypothetical protein [Soonwooa sp.]